MIGEKKTLLFSEKMETAGKKDRNPVRRKRKDQRT